jgi:RNA polymerase sigma factor (sigma-70 family)
MQRAEELVRAVGPRGLRIAARLIGSADAEDAVQEALLRTVDQDELGDPEGWFVRVLTNHCLGVLRRRAVWRALGLRGEDVDAAPPADAQLESARRAHDLRRRIARLPPMQQLVVQLRYGEELSIAEIASAARIGEETVKTHLQRAMERLRAEMGRS